MEVREIMTDDVKTCAPDVTLETVADLMWSKNIGCVPVVDPGGKPIGIVTDRDIAMSSFLNHKPIWDLRARDVIQGQTVRTCYADDPVSEAVEIMKNYRIRRLPVIDGKGHLKGLLSMDDLESATGIPGRTLLEEYQPLTVIDWMPMVDIAEEDQAYLVTAELPEIKKEETKVSVENGVLSISGSRKQERDEKDGIRHHRVERSYGAFLRSFILPDDADPSRISASMKEGVLEVRIEKRAGSPVRSGEIQIT